MLIPVFAYAFTAAEVGALEVAMFMGGLATALAAFNLNTTVSQRYTQAGIEDRPNQIALGLISMAATACITLAVAVPAGVLLLSVLPELDGRIALVELVLIGAVLNAFVGNMCVLLQLQSSSREFNLLYTLWAAIIVVCTVGFVAFVEPRAEAFALATTIAGVTCSVVGVVTMRDELARLAVIPGARSLVLATARLDLARATRLVPFLILGWALLFADRKILASAAGLDEVGVYGLAVRLASGVTVVLGPIQAAWWDASMNQTDDELPSTLRRVLHAQWIAACVFVVVAIIAGQGPIRDLLGDWFQPGVRYVPTLIVCATLMTAYVVPFALLTKAGRYTPMLVSMGLAVAVNIVLNLVLDSAHGAAGATAANLAAYVTLNVAAWWPLRRELREAALTRAGQIVGAMTISLTLALVVLFAPSLILSGYA